MGVFMKRIFIVILMILFVLSNSACDISNLNSNTNDSTASPEQSKTDYNKMQAAFAEYASQYNAINDDVIQAELWEDSFDKPVYTSELQLKYGDKNIYMILDRFDDIIYHNEKFIGIYDDFSENTYYFQIPKELYDKIIANNGIFDGIIFSVTDIKNEQRVSRLYSYADNNDYEFKYEPKLRIECELIDVYMSQ